MESPKKVAYIGNVDFRNKQLTFGIKEQDRTRHTYIIGKTGMGKSALLENLAIQDIRNGEGLCFIDPHGSTAEKLLDFIPEERIKDVIYFAPFDVDCPVGLNVLEKVEASKRHLVANGLMAAFKKTFGEERFSDRIQYILNNIILALLENENQTLLGVSRMLTDKEYRKFIVSNVKDPSVKAFWEEEFAKAGDKYQQEAAPGIQNKIGQFVANPLIRHIIGQKRTSFDIRKVMDEKKILIVNLSKGKVGEGNTQLIGSLLITKIYLASMSRADVGPYNLEKLPPFYFYVDEFQNFANESFASILSESRKYNLALTVANQYVEQMSDEVKSAVFGNVGTMITFRVGATDAEIFEKEFAPVFTADDLVNLSSRQIYLRLMIDGVGSKPFSAHTLNMEIRPEKSFASEVLAYSRKTYGRNVTEVEEEINDFFKPITPAPKVESKAPSHGPSQGPIIVQATNPFTNKTVYPTSNQTSNSSHPPVQNNKAREGVILHFKEDSSDKENLYKAKQKEQKMREERKKHFLKDVVNVMPEEKIKDEIRDVRNNINDTSKMPHVDRNLEYKENEKTDTRERLFDDKPAVSLKDALAKALNENKENGKNHEDADKVQSQPSVATDASQNSQSATTHTHPKSTEDVHRRKEVPEETLRKIIGE